MKVSIIVHGGAKTIEPHQEEAHRQGCLEALNAGWRELEARHSAIDAVEMAIRTLETLPSFNAGRGSALNRDGEVEMDASMMDGRTARCGAVAALRGVPHPISVARKVFESPEAVLLVGDGARRFAEEQGAELCSPNDLITDQQCEAWVEKKGSSDTVGCVALDSSGSIACGASTGRLTNKLVGRVGDSPLIGCGIFADHTGATAITGDGEQIVRLTLARTTVDFLRGERHPDHAAEMAINHFRQNRRGEAGCIVMDAVGRIGWSHNSSHLPCAFRSWEMDGPQVALQKRITRHARA